MSETPSVTVVTQHPHSDPMVITAPLNQPMSADTLVNNSAAFASLQAQFAALEARVAALEAAAP